MRFPAFQVTAAHLTQPCHLKACYWPSLVSSQAYILPPGERHTQACLCWSNSFPRWGCRVRKVTCFPPLWQGVELLRCECPPTSWCLLEPQGDHYCTHSVKGRVSSLQHRKPKWRSIKAQKTDFHEQQMWESGEVGSTGNEDGQSWQWVTQSRKQAYHMQGDRHPVWTTIAWWAWCERQSKQKTNNHRGAGLSKAKYKQLRRRDHCLSTQSSCWETHLSVWC